MKINIIGAGIAGLSAGCYLQMNGFETEIFEKQGRPGGLCTSWKVGDYTCNGGLQWLLGSGSASPFYALWSELMDMNSIGFVNHDVRMEIEVRDTADKYGSRIFRLYTNLARLEDYLMDIAPEDKFRIHRLIRSIREIQGYEVPPMIGAISQHFSFMQSVGMIKHLPLLLFMWKNRHVTNFTQAEKFKNPFLKEAFRLLYDGDEYSLLITTVPLAFSDRKATGYPVGGSACVVEQLEKKYLSLGGKIHCGAGVKEIITEKGVARGIRLENGKEIPSVVTVSAADWHFTVFEALHGKYVNKKILHLRDQKELKVYYSIVSVSLGLSRTFDDFPYFSRFPLSRDLISPDGTRYSRMELHVYNYDPTLAPAGKTPVSVSFYTRNSDFWIGLYQSDRARYEQVKTGFAGEVISILDEKFGSVRKHIEAVSVATPATFYRYTNNWKGSTQGWLPGKNILKQSPVRYELPGLRNFYLAGHWTIPGGGLPVAVKSARDVAQLICKRNGKRFSGTPDSPPS